MGKPNISADRVIKCAFYAQGCHGGFPYLASKYHQDFGSVTESTEPYTATDGRCPAVSKNQFVSRNVGYKYVGGYYGASGENGYFRTKRGDDNLNIEHMSVAAYPRLGHVF